MRRAEQARDGLIGNEGHQHELRKRVDEASQHFETPIAIAAPRIRRPPGKPRAHHGQQQRQCINQHMTGIGYQGE